MAVTLLEREHCPLCESSNTETLCDIPYSDAELKRFLGDFYAQRADISLFAGDRYRVNQCQSCCFIYQQAILNQDGQALLYGEWVDQQKSRGKKQQAKAKLFRQYAGQLDTISRLLPLPPHQSNILEYGMGWGYWSRMASAFGYQVSGLELSPERVEHVRSLGLKVIDALPEAGEHFDLIYANQVFEHLDQPMQVLSDLSTCLKPDGIVYLRVPDGAGVEKTLRQSGWNASLDAIHPFEHINCFTRKTLILLGRKAGLVPVQPPLRIELSRFWGGLKREVNDRWFTTHVFFRKG